MKNTYRTAAAFLAAILSVTAFSACGEQTSSEDTTAEQNGSDTQTETTAHVVEVRDLGKRDVNVLLRSEWKYEFMVDEESGDTVADAIFRRNAGIEEKYNCNFNFIDLPGNWANHDSFTNTIHNSVLAGDKAYDFIAGYQAVLTTNIQNGDLMNLYEVPNLCMDAPYWTNEGVKALTFNGKCFMVGGDIAVSLLEGINCMFYNKALAENYKTPDIYDIVRKGEWTHDKMGELSKDHYSDVNANDTKDNEDSFGMATQQSFIRPYVVAYNTPTISSEGKLIWNNEHTVSVVEKLVDFFAEPDNHYTTNTDEVQKIFSDGRALLMNTTLGAASKLRSMNDDFGIIPMPKFDGEQESYMTTTSNEVTMMCVPITAPDPDISGLVLEAMCDASTDTVANAFYNVALQGKYARDEESLEMISLIRSSLTFDFGWVSSLATDVSGAQYEIMVREGNKAFASWYATKESSVTERTNNYLDVYRD